AVAQQHGDVCRLEVGHGQIRHAIAVEIARRHGAIGAKARSGWIRDGSYEGAVALAQQQQAPVARSSLPSRLKSPTAYEASPPSWLSATWKLPSPLPSRTKMSSPLATARSGLPSLLKSPTA